MSGRRVLVLGGGGREHALAVRLAQSESVVDVLVSPGNAGTQGCRVGGVTLSNAEGKPLEVAKAVRPDLVVVGPEAPLCDGLVDQLQAEGLAVYGPTKAAARLEGSKAFMKDAAQRWGIPTAKYVVVRDPAELEDALSQFQTPPVVKADGLCAGKGVVVPGSFDEARTAARRMLSGQAFGSAGRVVVIEERLVGAEVSVHAICDGERYWLLPLVQDHKRLRDGDEGPNTGGMGTYGPVPFASSAVQQTVGSRVIEPVLRGMAEAGTPFRGTLFANMMLVEGREPLLLEINVRFGDPETQVLMNILPGDMYEVLRGAAAGRLEAPAPHFQSSGQSGVCVVLAARGYPEAPETGDAIEGLEEAESVPGVRVYHAGTRGDRAVTSGGRVLGVVGVADSLATAHAAAYAAARKIQFPGVQMRTDIGAQALGGSRG